MNINNNALFVTYDVVIYDQLSSVSRFAKEFHFFSTRNFEPKNFFSCNKSKYTKRAKLV